MATAAFAGVGTLFQIDETASSVAEWATLAEVNSIAGPNKTRSTFDATSLDSTGGYREFIASFRDAGEVTLEMNFTIASYNKMNDQFESDASEQYQIVMADDGLTTLAFTAWCTAIGSSVPLDDKVTSSVTLKITGQVTLTT